MYVTLTLVLLAALLIIGVPVGFALLATGVVGITLVASPEAMLGLVQTVPFRSTSQYALVTIPMFILMAQFITKGGLARDIFDALKVWSGRIPGGAAIATIYASAGLGAICGSSAAAASTMGQVAIPELKRLGYPPSFAVGSVAVAGTLAIMIPPSTGLILYAILTSSSIGGILLAGILPGLLTATAFALVVLLWAPRAIKRGHAPVGESFSILQKLKAARTLWPFLVLILSILGGIYSGAVSAIEASALGAITSLILLALLRRISLREAIDAVRDTVYLSAMIAIIIAGAALFGYFLTVARVPQQLLTSLTSAGLSRLTVLLVIVVAIVVLGFFMDQIAILSLAVPIVFPVIQQLGYNAIWFGIVFTALAEIGLVTPPMGMNVFIASAAGGERIEVGFQGIWRFVAAQVVVVAALIAFPQIALFLVPAGLT